jgi:eukaryotic-like serine/threonine-protein kinase
MAQPPDQPPDPHPDDETVIRDEWPPEDDVYVEQTEDVPPPRRPPTIWPWLLAFLVLVLGGLGALWYFSQDDDEDDAAATTAVETVERTVAVPDVVGTTSSEATATLRDAGLEANVASVPSDAPAGQVVAQDPAAGDEVAEGTAVRLNVARPATDTTPATTGPGTTTEPPATTTEPPATTTEPPATTTEPPATTTAPPEPAVVPSVVGDELARAAEAFGDEGLKVSVRYVPSREARGRVVAQAQPPGTELSVGDTVQLNVSIGADPPANVAVPDVTGLDQAEARERLDRAGFEVLAIELDEGDEGDVLSQTPAGGASIPRGSLVVLYVGD